LEISYSFWESIEERAERLEILWEESQSFIKEVESPEGAMLEKIREAISALRDLRWKMDQLLESEFVDPVFKENYMTYTREEFLADSEVNYSKLVSLFINPPEILAKDPEVGPCYEKIIELITQTPIDENTSKGYFTTDGVYNWDAYEPSKLETPTEGEGGEDEEEERKDEFLDRDEYRGEPLEDDPVDEASSIMLESPETLKEETQNSEERQKVKLISQLKATITAEIEATKASKSMTEKEKKKKERAEAKAKKAKEAKNQDKTATKPKKK